MNIKVVYTYKQTTKFSLVKYIVSIFLEILCNLEHLPYALGGAKTLLINDAFEVLRERIPLNDSFPEMLFTLE